MHKCVTNPTGRRVISGNDGLTEPVSKHVHYFIKSFLPSVPAYVQDTTDVLKDSNIRK